MNQQFKKVSKRTARRLYERGCTITLLPHKVSVGDDVDMLTACWDSDRTASFDGIVLRHSLLTCSVKSGQYLAYYISSN